MPSATNEEGGYERKGGNRTYLTTLNINDKNGKRKHVFASKVTEDTEGACSRTNKEGKLVWEKYFDGYRLSIKSVWIDKTKPKFGKQLCIAGKSAVIQVPLKSNHYKQFVAHCKSIDLSEPVLFDLYCMPKKTESGKQIKNDDGKDVYLTGWTLKQGGTTKDDKLEPCLDTSKDGPMPAWRKLRNGEWDTSDQDEFLEEFLNEWIEENDLKPKRQEKVEEEEETEEEEEEDDPPVKKVKAKVVSSKKMEVVDDDDDDIP